MVEARHSAPSLARLLATLEHEAHGRLSGRDRLASVFANGVPAVMPNELALFFLAGIQEAQQ